jgi:hypothetical protein
MQTLRFQVSRFLFDSGAIYSIYSYILIFKLKLNKAC